MAARNDFTPNKLEFDVAAFMKTFKDVCNLYLDDLSQKLINIIRGEIMLNGNGSYKVMRLTAALLVKETKREITDDHITLEVGLDMDEIKQKSEEIFVRVSVVLHGNVSSIMGGPYRGTWRNPAPGLYTKPGQMTYKKHVTNKSMSTAKTVYPLPDEFTQEDVSVDISKNVSNNVSNQANKFVNMFLTGLTGALRSLNLAAFLTVR